MLEWLQVSLKTVGFPVMDQVMEGSVLEYRGPIGDLVHQEGANLVLQECQVELLVLGLVLEARHGHQHLKVVLGVPVGHVATMVHVGALGVILPEAVPEDPGALGLGMHLLLSSQGLPKTTLSTK